MIHPSLNSIYDLLNFGNLGAIAYCECSGQSGTNGRQHFCRYRLLSKAFIWRRTENCGDGRSHSSGRINVVDVNFIAHRFEQYLYGDNRRNSRSTSVDARASNTIDDIVDRV